MVRGEKEGDGGVVLTGSGVRVIADRKMLPPMSGRQLS